MTKPIDPRHQARQPQPGARQGRPSSDPRVPRHPRPGTRIPASSAGCSRALRPSRRRTRRSGPRRGDARRGRGRRPDGDNPHVPAGFTYLGQFVDHDITLDLTSLGEKEKDPLGDRELPHPEPRPRLPLRARAGRQPAPLRPRSADRRQARAEVPDRHRTSRSDSGGVTGDFRNDLPRSPEGFALIGDHRNDENLLVAQTHLAHAQVPQQGRRHRRRPAERRRRQSSRRPAGSSPGTTSGWCCTTSSSG